MIGKKIPFPAGMVQARSTLPPPDPAKNHAYFHYRHLSDFCH
jgi:hypothetical protein